MKKCEHCSKEKEEFVGDICKQCWDELDAHYCHDWDGMLIDRTWPEYDCCTCVGKQYKYEGEKI